LAVGTNAQHHGVDFRDSDYSSVMDMARIGHQQHARVRIATDYMPICEQKAIPVGVFNAESCTKAGVLLDTRSN